MRDFPSAGDRWRVPGGGCSVRMRATVLSRVPSGPTVDGRVARVRIKPAERCSTNVCIVGP